jgi:fermentation-respiration switch protein FrsA (DUF1100 family)
MLTATPLLIVHGTGDQACPPDDARSAYDAAGGPKELVWLDEATKHVDIYDREDLVTAAAESAVAWFDKHLH